MALISTSGPINMEYDAALATTGVLTATRWKAGNPVEVIRIGCGPVSSTGTTQCGYVSLRDGTTVIARYYVTWVATAASQSDCQSFEVGAVYTPATSLNVLYTAVTEGATAIVWFTWR